jgi:tetratricopeptide (TPR) repeat protein
MAKKASFLDAFKKGLGPKKGTKDKEIGKYEKILEESPDDRNALNALGDLYAKRGDSGKACDYYLQVGKLYAKDGFTLKAIAVYKKAQRAKPDLIQTYVDLADLYVQKGLIGEAKSNYLTAAEMQAAAGAKHDSLDIYRRIADLDPRNVNIRSKLAAMYEKEDFIEDAATIYAEIGDVAIEKDNDEGKKFYHRAMELQPESEDILSRIGYVYAERDMRQEATDIFQKLLQLNPGNIDYQEQLEELQAMSDLQGAVIPDVSTITFSEEELSSLNLDETQGAAAVPPPADDHALDFQLTDVSAEATPPAQSPENHALDFQIDDQAPLNLGDMPSEPAPPLADDHALDFSLEEAGPQVAMPEEGGNQAPPAESSGFFDLASRLDTAVQIGRKYDTEQPQGVSYPSNLKVEASENLASSEISDIIREFKQGVLEEVGAEDYETHYELGISYKEMSLLDDAIEELKLAALEPSKFVECQGVIGLCYVEKGDYVNAVTAFQEARSRVNQQSEEFQDLTYQIAVSYEESGKIEEAAQELQTLYQKNAGYRDVKQRLKRLLG